jgi:hypothetical protein
MVAANGFGLGFRTRTGARAASQRHDTGEEKDRGGLRKSSHRPPQLQFERQATGANFSR